MEKKDSKILTENDSYEKDADCGEISLFLLKKPKSFKAINDEDTSLPSTPLRRRLRRSPTKTNLKIEYKPEEESDADYLLKSEPNLASLPKNSTDHDAIKSNIYNNDIKLDSHPRDHHDQFNAVKQKEQLLDESGNVVISASGVNLQRYQTDEEKGRESPSRLMHSEQLRDRIIRKRNKDYSKPAMVPFGGSKNNQNSKKSKKLKKSKKTRKSRKSRKSKKVLKYKKGGINDILAALK
tara:strand:+ start:1852 stop:2565 length:714 start_codon:yes stop_codon:yes gene_type:complete